VIVFATVLAKKTLHQPRFCQFRRNIKNAIKKDLCDFPSFFRNRSRSVTTIHTNDRVFGMPLFRSRFNVSFEI